MAPTVKGNKANLFFSLTGWFSQIRSHMCMATMATFYCLGLCFVASTARPSCWAVLAQGNQVSIVAAVEDRLYLLDPFEPQLQVMPTLHPDSHSSSTYFINITNSQDMCTTIDT